MKSVSISTLPVSLNCLFLLLFFFSGYLFLALLSFLVHIQLCLFLFFKYETCFYCLYSGNYLLKANGNLSGEKAMEMARSFHIRIVVALVTSCLMVGIFTSIQVVSDLTTNNRLNIMFPLIIQVKKLFFIKYTTLNLFLNAFYSEGAVLFRNMISCAIHY